MCSIGDLLPERPVPPSSNPSPRRPTTHIGELFRERREKAGLTIKDVATATRLKNLNKQMRVLQAIENGRDPFPKDEYVERFAKVLGIDSGDIVQAISLDWEEHEQWATTPVKLRLEVKIIPCIYVPRSLPDGCTMEEAEAIARRVCQEEKRDVWLIYARDRAKIFHTDGTVGIGSRAIVRVGRFNAQAQAVAKRAWSVPREPPAKRDR